LGLPASSSAPIVVNAGSMLSIDSATNDVSSAHNPTNSAGDGSGALLRLLA